MYLNTNFIRFFSKVLNTKKKMSFKYTYFKYCPSLYLYIKYEALTLFWGVWALNNFVGLACVFCIAEGENFLS